MIIWLLVAGCGVFFVGRTAYRVYRERRVTARERLENMLKETKFGRRAVQDALDAYREEILDEAGDPDTDWEAYFFGATQAVRDYLGDLVKTRSFEEPEEELEEVRAGLALYPDAHAVQLADAARAWTRRLRRANRITQYDYDQRNKAIDHTDPEQEIDAS